MKYMNWCCGEEHLLVLHNSMSGCICLEHHEDEIGFGGWVDIHNPGQMLIRALEQYEALGALGSKTPQCFVLLMRLIRLDPKQITGSILIKIASEIAREYELT